MESIFEETRKKGIENRIKIHDIDGWRNIYAFDIKEMTPYISEYINDDANKLSLHMTFIKRWFWPINSNFQSVEDDVDDHDHDNDIYFKYRVLCNKLRTVCQMGKCRAYSNKWMCQPNK